MPYSRQPTSLHDHIRRAKASENKTPIKHARLINDEFDEE